ncbi:hypothetical protein AVEN_179146-1 [Araneus ventricosus]|uniref:Uncharacterized protein n=1 Tax=Araneus ventricosus TaxID=182803 RepID=A0A4Y2UMB5_ARAVE|nr:hypothetical protein AVEN_179146-1 [Araneus ventricosus]
MTWTTPELAPPLQTSAPHRREDVDPRQIYGATGQKHGVIFSGIRLEAGTLPTANAYYFCSVFKPGSEYDSNDAVNFNGFRDFVGIDTITYDDVVVAIKELKST